MSARFKLQITNVTTGNLKLIPYRRTHYDSVGRIIDNSFMHFLFGEDEVCVNTGANHTPCTCINHKAILISFTRHSDTYSCKKINCPPLKFMTDNQNLSGTLMNTFNQQLFAQDNKYEALVCLCLFPVSYTHLTLPTIYSV